MLAAKRASVPRLLKIKVFPIQTVIRAHKLISWPSLVPRMFLNKCHIGYSNLSKDGKNPETCVTNEYLHSLRIEAKSAWNFISTVSTYFRNMILMSCIVVGLGTTLQAGVWGFDSR
jgi:hypothetical protein